MRPVLRSIDQLADQIGLKQSDRRRLHDADDYWADSDGAAWRDDSHWRGAGTLGSDDDWLSIGAEHLHLTRRLAPGILEGPRPRVVEWGAGGGANAVHFAPLAAEFIATDVSQASLDECARQVAAVCTTPCRTALLDLVHPEAAVPAVGAPCDLFICFYVLELVPSEEYGLRVLRIAHSVLRPGGVAIVQIKYRTADRRTRSHFRRYRRNVANMTTYAIDEFWLASERCGFDPRAVVLVPKNRLDERYAYFALTKPE
jgi:SAM-dependent methyltransferase